MKNETRTPQIRYKGLCDNWESHKIEDIFDVITDYVAAGSFADLAENVVYKNAPDYAQLIRTTDLKNKFSSSDYVYVDKHAFEFLYRVNLNKESIVLPNIGNCGEVYYITPEMLPYPNNVLGPNAILIQSNNSDIKFLSVLLQGNDFQNNLSLIISPNGQTKFNKTELKGIKVVLPKTREEQYKIGEIFFEFDNIISLQQQKYNQLVNMKSSLLEKMFPHDGAKVPEIRFDGFTGDWTEEKLGRISNLLTGYPFESKYFSNSGIRLIRGVNVKRGYLDMSSDLCEYWPTSTGLDEYLLQQGDIVIQMDGAMIGRSYAMINNDDLPSLLVQRVTRVRTDEELSAYLYYCIQKGFLNYILGLKTETAVPHLSLKDIANYTIKVPQDEKEAICIGNFFQQMDKSITCLQQQIDQLKNIKQSFMDKMFVS